MKISNIFIYGKGFKKYIFYQMYVFWVLGTYIVPVHNGNLVVNKV